MDDTRFFLLLAVAKAAGLQGSATTSTSKLAAPLNCSQQTISRQLRELEAARLVNRRASPSGMQLSLTEEGRVALKNVYLELSHALQAHGASRPLKGVLETGLKEGAYYMSLRPYQQQLREKLGFTPFVGTLNLRVHEAELLSFLDGAKEIYVKGFETKERTFGGLKAYRVRVNGQISGALILPDRTMHRAVAEVVAKEKLRDALSLKDGDTVTLALEE